MMQGRGYGVGRADRRATWGAIQCQVRMQLQVRWRHLKSAAITPWNRFDLRKLQGGCRGVGMRDCAARLLGSHKQGTPGAPSSVLACPPRGHPGRIQGGRRGPPLLPTAASLPARPSRTPARPPPPRSPPREQPRAAAHVHQHLAIPGLQVVHGQLVLPVGAGEACRAARGPALNTVVTNMAATKMAMTPCQCHAAGPPAPPPPSPSSWVPMWRRVVPYQ